jgi:hypothetical protein
MGHPLGHTLMNTLAKHSAAFLLGFPVVLFQFKILTEVMVFGWMRIFSIHKDVSMV